MTSSPTGIQCLLHSSSKQLWRAPSPSVGLLLCSALLPAFDLLKLVKAAFCEHLLLRLHHLSVSKRFTIHALEAPAKSPVLLHSMLPSSYQLASFVLHIFACL